MKRRDFNKVATAAFGAMALSPLATTGPVVPKRLKPGDQVGLIAPGSPVEPEKINEALKTLEAWELKPKLGKHVHRSLGYLAGTDAERLEDLHAMFTNPEISAIWCLRGGYGCTRLLPHIDFSVIRNNPKIFLGYSDITALHLAINQQCQLITYHGPVATSKPTLYSQQWLQKIIFDGQPQTIGRAPEHQNHSELKNDYRGYAINSGVASGRLCGGNLSLLAALAGTPWSPSYRNKLVFIEDIGEEPYRIDRMLVQMFQATDLSEAAGIILGIFNDCGPDNPDRSLSLEETLRQQLESLRIPVYYGFSFGHIDDQCTIPQGIMATFDTTDATLQLQENTVL